MALRQKCHRFCQGFLARSGSVSVRVRLRGQWFAPSSDFHKDDIVRSLPNRRSGRRAKPAPPNHTGRLFVTARMLTSAAALAITVAGLSGVAYAQAAREQIRIVGSSTVFPYTQAVAEQYSA